LGGFGHGSYTSAPMKLTVHQYGKARVRVARVLREGGRHSIFEADVQVMLAGDFATSFTEGDNSLVVPTDTMKNTVNVLAQTELGPEIERFGLALSRHFLGKYPQVQRCEITLTGKSWQRIGDHDHAFSGNDSSRTWAQISATLDSTDISAGVRDFLVLKSTASSFMGYPRCEFTTLPETQDRIFSTLITATWDFAKQPSSFTSAREAAMNAMLRVFSENFSPSVQLTLYQMGEAALATVPELARIHLALPNKHYLLVNFSSFGLTNPNEVFTPTDEPHGQIEATIARE
jgi:urate oxidase